jgi:hypothetical protein
VSKLSQLQRVVVQLLLVVSMENEIQRRECLLIVTISGLPICRELSDIDAVIKMGNIVLLRGWTETI